MAPSTHTLKTIANVLKIYVRNIKLKIFEENVGEIPLKLGYRRLSYCIRSTDPKRKKTDEYDYINNLCASKNNETTSHKFWKDI